ncbi:MULTISPECIES: hypothetical protein [unclassified Acidovorax]|uniref:hypothetical protein n=1 Tax=unclassified Acidovorax TaxID=2684926 RepID=UPI001C4639AC|nr:MULTISPECIES: hypothetical protein [unclassified Acidovorax]MBV7462923.1 hypothetical protein [Acidovorax sp. sif0632]MBV7467949.1 hypothetical protein [Acidovorax sp. sif0613]
MGHTTVEFIRGFNAVVYKSEKICWVVRFAWTSTGWQRIDVIRVAAPLSRALIAALFVLASNTLLRPVVNRINRHPIDEELTEAAYPVFMVCQREAQAEAQDKLVQLLEMPPTI